MTKYVARNRAAPPAQLIHLDIGRGAVMSPLQAGGDVMRIDVTRVCH